MKRVLAVAATFAVLAACGGGGGGEDQAAATTTAAPSTTATTVFDGDRAKAEITTLYTTFFNDQTPTDQQVQMLENGEALKGAIEQNRTSGAATGLSVNVKSVQLSSPLEGTVNFDILLKGAVVAPNTQGKAKWLDGRWKVDQKLFCTLLNLGNQNPPACEAVLSGG